MKWMCSMSQTNAKDDSKAFSLSNLKERVAINWNGENHEEACWQTKSFSTETENQEFSFRDSKFEMHSDIKIKELI